MNVYEKTPGWKAFVSKPETREWQERIAARLEELFERDVPVSPEAFTDITGEFTETLRGSFALVFGRPRIPPEQDILELYQARWLIGQALAGIFLSSRVDVLKILKFAEATWAGEEFDAGLRSAAVGEEGLRHMLVRFREAVDRLEGEPEMYCGIRSERENARELIRQWTQERILKDMYSPAWSWDSVPWDDVPKLGALGALLPAHSGAVAELLSAITVPPVMRDTLWTLRRNCTQDAGDCFSALLKDAPDCREAAEAGQWNGQLLAPALLQWGLVHGQKELEKAADGNEVRDSAVSKLAAMWESFAQILKARPDGQMLMRAFLAGNLPMDRGDARPAELMGLPWEIARAALAKSMPDLSANTEKIFQETFGKSMAQARDDWKDFVESGRLRPAGRLMNLSSLLGILPDAERGTAADNAHAALDMFRYLPAYEKNGLYTSEYSRLPEKSHRAVGELYSRQAAPAACWSQTWQQLSGLRHRLRQAPYGEQVVDQYSTLNFVLVAGICAAKRLREENRAEDARSMAGEVGRAIRQYSAWARLEQRFLTKLRNLYARYIGEPDPTSE